MNPALPRGIRNNNPGNVRYNKTKWHGLDNPPSDGVFCRFKIVAFGIRAMAKTIKNYKEKYNLNTISDIISRWAPPVENNTTSYIKFVCSATGLTEFQKLDLNSQDIFLICKAIIKQENGTCPYSDEEIKNGVSKC